MNIDMEVYDGWKRRYTLRLSAGDMEHIYAGWPEEDAVVGAHRPTQTYFYIFEGIQRPEAFVPMPDQGYQIHIGAPAPIIPSGASSQEQERLGALFMSRLDSALTEKAFSLRDRTGKDLGQVVISIEK